MFDHKTNYNIYIYIYIYIYILIQVNLILFSMPFGLPRTNPVQLSFTKFYIRFIHLAYISLFNLVSHSHDPRHRIRVTTDDDSHLKTNISLLLFTSTHHTN